MLAFEAKIANSGASESSPLLSWAGSTA